MASEGTGSTMPLYDYECRRCGPFREWRRMRDYEKPTTCPRCRKRARRTMATPVLAMDAGLRKAHAFNEKSAHEPRVERRRTGHSHGHDHGNSRFREMDGPGHYVRARSPWMVGH
jgi:putative FmdB family regulatory protein